MPTGIQFTIDLNPFADIMDEIRSVSDVFLAGEIEKSIMPKVVDLVVPALKAAAPQDKGLLKRSISGKIVAFRAGLIVVAIVGSDRDVFVPVTRVAIRDKKGRPPRIKGMAYQSGFRPANYFHLVEGGHKQIVWKRNNAGIAELREVGFVPAKPFAQMTIDANQGKINDIIGAGLQDILNKAKS